MYPAENKYLFANAHSPNQPRLPTNLQHPIHRLLRRHPQFLIHGDLRSFILHAEIELLQRIQLHVRAVVAGATVGGGCGYECLMRAALLHLVQYTGFGGHDILV